MDQSSHNPIHPINNIKTMNSTKADSSENSETIVIEPGLVLLRNFVPDVECQRIVALALFLYVSPASCLSPLFDEHCATSSNE